MTTRIARAFRGGFAIIVTLGMALCVAGVARGQAYDLIISEYIEGSSNNKAIEIFNGTGAAVNLAAGGYKLRLFANGAAVTGTVTSELSLSGTLAAGATYVVANSAANAAILAAAQITSGVANFNGDDAVLLTKGSSNTVVDSFGQGGTDPGTNWGSGNTSSMDRTLRRKASVVWGRTAATSAFDPAVEWDGFAIDTSSGLGSHTADLIATPATVSASGGANAGSDGWTVSASGTAGTFQGNSASNATEGAPSGAGAGNPAWGLYANSGGTVSATRLLEGGWLRPGQSASIQMDNGWIDNGSSVGVEFHQIATTGVSNAALTVKFTGGGSFYTVTDSAGVTNSTIGFTGDGLTVSVKLTAQGAYTVAFGGFSRSGTLAGNANSINAIRIFNANAGSGSARDAYFNAVIVTCIDMDSDGVCASTDCDDNNASVGAASVTYYLDSDGDGYGVSGTAQVACTQPSGYATQAGDCDDALPSVYTGAPELCDGLDNDCDTTVDEDITFVNYYPDTDGDGFGAAGSSPTSACSQPANTASNNTDCNDNNSAIKPGATEVCDGVDNNCAGGIDEGVLLTFYRDVDLDTYGNAAVTQQGCTAPSGYVANSTDCDDADATINPAGTEVCDAANTDEDCDGLADDLDTGGATGKTSWYADADGDTYGAGSATSACDAPAGRVSSSTDCNDSNAAINPGASEACDGVDNNCDGTIDPSNCTSQVIAGNGRGGFGGPIGGSTLSVARDGADWVFTLTKGAGGFNDALVLYFDTEVGGFSSTAGFTDAGDYLRKAISGYNGSTRATVNFPAGFTADHVIALSPSGNAQFGGGWKLVEGGAHDFRASVNLSPSTSTTSATYTFRIARSLFGISSGGTFKMVGTYLNPNDPFRSNEGYGEGLPSSNVGAASCTFTTFVSLVVPCTDVDNDGVCAENDCNDNDATIYAGATELCDGKDNDCDGSTDEGLTQYTYYRDADGDSFGISTVTNTTCSATAPTGYVSDSSDCDDSAVLYADSDGDGFGAGSPAACGVATNTDCGPSSSAVYPGAPELCGSVGIDNDCDSDSAEIDANASDRVAYYNDGDGDGVTTATATLFCPGAAGASYQSSASNPADCDDADATVKPGAAELCSTVGTDNNCNGSATDVDENASDKVAFYTDGDSDTYTLSTTALFCPGTTNAGYRATVSSPLDCDDDDAAIYPTAPELCANSTVDNDCDLNATEIDFNAADKVSFYRDQDGDGISSAATGLFCPGTTNARYLATLSSPVDCNDSNAFVGVPSVYYADADADGLGDASSTGSACAVVSAQWTIPTALASSVTGRDITYGAADAGTLTGDSSLSGYHASASAVYSTISGNGSPYSLSSSFWAVGDYYQVQFSTIGMTGVSVNWDQTRSGTGPSSFKVMVSVDGGQNFAEVASYTVDSVSWSTSTASSNSTFASELGASAANKSTVVVRFQCAAAASGTGGTNRIDNITVNGSAPPTGYAANSDDCNDSDSAIGAARTYYRDADGDGSGLSTDSQTACVQPTGYVANSNDCNDANNTVYTGAPELCDNIDNDCDTVVDEGITFSNYYTDADGDGYGSNLATAVSSCSPVANSVTNNSDCNDNNAAIKPGATEVCDGVDNNCTGGIDEGVTTTYYLDFDGDGYGATTPTVQACTLPAGYSVNNTDCNDAIPGINPAAQEVCDGSNTDEDCDNLADDADSSADDAGKTSFYRDQDGDGFTTSTATRFCDLPAGYEAAPEGDCNDGSTAVYPGAPELCTNDGVDNDCDGEANADSEATDATSYYADSDNDGYGTGTAVQSCTAVTGRVTNNTDCDDSRATANPAASEICNGLDDDCDSTADDGLTFSNYYTDADNDGYGATTATAQSSCAPVAGMVTNNTDCDDARAAINPGAIESCDGVDNDCDGVADASSCTSISAAGNGGAGFGGVIGAGSLAISAAGTDVSFTLTRGTGDFGDALVLYFDSKTGGFASTANFTDAPSGDYLRRAISGLAGSARSTVNFPVGFTADFAIAIAPSASFAGLWALAENGAHTFVASANLNPASSVNAASYTFSVARSDLGITGGADATFRMVGTYLNADNAFRSNEGFGTGLPASNPGAATVTFTSAITIAAPCTDADGDGFCAGVDCDDTKPLYADADNDGVGAGSPTACGVTTNTDCAPLDNTIYPGAAELCSNLTVDNDCDGDTTEAEASDRVAYYIDTDGDGSGSGTSVLACTAPTGYVANANDGCPDNPALIAPATYYRDADGDTYTTSTTTQACALPSGYRATASGAVDCDDSDPAINPLAQEVCDGSDVDEDCDGAADDADSSATGQTNWYADTDGDGFGAGTATSACNAPAGTVSNSGDQCPDNALLTSPATYYRDQDGDTYTTSDTTTACSLPTGYRATASGSADCDDANAAVNPGATESCNGIDDDCTGGVDNGLTFSDYYGDSDMDGAGDPAVVQNACSQPAGFVANSNDLCPSNGGLVNRATYYRDVDGDTYGDAAVTESTCSSSPSTGYVSNSGDCDDSRAGVNPAAQEVCDAANIDEDCDGLADNADESATGKTDWYADTDNDGYGAGSAISACDAVGSQVASSNDCAPTNGAINPGAQEVCDGSDVDEDCDGAADDADSSATGQTNWYADTDGDGFGAGTATSACNAPAGTVSNATDQCPDNALLTSPATYYRDQDGDTYTTSDTTTACSLPTGYRTTASGSADCDDANAAVNPGATESCNGVDDDCTGGIDNGLTFTNYYGDSDMDGAGDPAVVQNACSQPAGFVTNSNDLCPSNGSLVNRATYYRDFDGDSYGDAAVTESTCSSSPSTGYVSNSGDCDDSRAGVNPAAQEVCDAANTDEDCDGLADNADSSATGKTNWYADSDNDGYGAGSAISACDAVGSQVAVSGDCDDARPDVSPADPEVCDPSNVDEDCDGQADDLDVQGATGKVTYYVDSDNDTYSTAATASFCDVPAMGYRATLSSPVDCNDAVPGINPGATEVCDGFDVDENCNGISDNNDPGAADAGKTNFYRDQDGDGYTVDTATRFCDMPTGYEASPEGDCNDASTAVNPGAVENCANLGADNDCDGVNNAAEAIDSTAYYIDADIDGFGSNTAEAVRSCTAVAGSVTNNSDCDDTRRLYADVDGDGFGAGAAVACGVPTNTDCNDGSNAIFPGAPESCNGIDDDCDAQVDENITFSNYYVDVDGDGYGAAGSTPQNSCSPIAGRVTNASDCNDAVAAINPGAQEVCDLANTDEDCDGAADNADPSAADAGKTNFYRDQDGDGFTGSSVGRFCDLPTGYEGTAEGDCNDSNAAIFPTAVETCANLGTDNDCDGVNNAAEATDATNYYTDADNDSFGSSTATAVRSCSAVAGSVANNSDCNDALVTYVDGDGDGVGAGSPAACGVATSNDCNDANNAIFPGAVENCANLGVNNDCDGDNSAAEAVDATNYYTDADNDGFGSSAATAVRSCTVVAGSVTNNSDCNDALVTYADGDDDGFGAGSAVACGVAANTDCNDADASIFPNATETCDGVDQDCDGTADDGLTFLDYYTDGDGDGFGSPAASAQNSCAPVTGKAPNNTDCDDANATAFPGATELCNGIDDDCDNAVDEDVGAVSFYRDADGDGFGNAADSVQNCTGVAPEGYVANSSDCDDTRLLYADTDGDGFGAGSPVACGVATNTDCDPARATAYPGAAELCNGLDDDCDAAADDGLTFSDYYIDADGDGFGAAGSAPVSACAPVAGRVLGNSSDCDDSRASVYPGAAETCNQRDDDCDALVDEGLPLVSYFPDVDGDTYGSDSVAAERSCAPIAGKVANNLDCDDTRATAYFGAPELCNGLDDDCDSAADDGLTFLDYYTDADADGYGATDATAQNSCAAVPGKAPNNTDCDDARAATNPGAAEVCNGIDDDCTGGIDNGLIYLDYYADSDGDGYGISSGTAENSCNPVTGKVPNNLDCNDTNPAISPDATESCNGIDDNCTGGIDDGLVFLDYYSDSDGDTYGASNGSAQSSCNPVSGKVTNNLDCNDGNAAIRPGATETCNGVDDDCDSAIDDGLTFTTFYRDADGDGFGSSATTVENCTGVAPTGYVATGGDCDDARVLYADADGDGLGVGAPAACGAPVLGDNCPTVANADQANCDGDAEGNACDANDDNDIALDINDAYPCTAGQYRLDSSFSASQITAFLATATAATVDATGMDATQLAAIAAGAESLAPNGIIGTVVITAALSDLEIYAILGNIAASFGGGGPTVTVDGSAITGPPAYPEMDADQLGAVADNIGVVNSVEDVTLTADLDPSAIAAIVSVAPNGEATIDATGMDASQLVASVSGASVVVIEGEVLIDSGVTGAAFTEVLAQLASPAGGTTVQFDTTGMSNAEQAAVTAAINTQLAGSYCSIADADFDTYYTSACLVQYTDCNDGNAAVNPGNLPVLSGVPASASVPADAGTTAGAQFTNPVTASDSCEGDLTSSIALAITYPGGGTSPSWPAGGMFPVGVSSVTWSITDAINQTVTATRTIEVLNYQLLDATVTFGGVFLGSTNRQVRVTHGGSSSVVTVPVSAGTTPTILISDLPVPVAAGYPCLAAKNPSHTLTDTASASVVSRRYAASFTLRQGDANNDDVVDIFDYAAFISARGSGRATDAVSNYNGDTDINTFDFTFISFAFLATGESCSPSFNPPAPRTRVSVKDLRRAGLGDMAAADINHDGWVDTRDMQLFMQSGGGANGGLDAPMGEPARRW